MRAPLLALALLTVACNDAPVEDTGPVDLRVDYPEPVESALIFETPDLVIPAYSDVQMCTALTYTGEDVGIVHMMNYQGPGGHHLVLYGTTTPAREIPDGETWDCTATEDLQMENMEPVIFGGTLERRDDVTLNELDLPDGMAVLLQSNQRFVVQAHYINATADDILVHDEAQFEVIPEDQVETWAAPFALSSDQFLIPAGTDSYTRTFTCTWDQEPVNALFMGGHMHEWGKSFKTTRTRGDGPEEVLVDEPVWDAVYRDAPNMLEFEPGELMFEQGDQLTTTCEWFNDEPEDLVFPHEMCVTFALVYPAKLPWICSDGN